MFAIGGFCKAYKTILSKKHSHEKNDSHGKFNHQSRKGSNRNHPDANDERKNKNNINLPESIKEEEDDGSLSSNIFERIEKNLPQPQSKIQSPLTRSTSLDDASSLSRNKSRNLRNPNEFHMPNREVSSSSSACDSLPRSSSQKALSTSSHRLMGKYYSQKGSLSDLHSIDEGNPSVKTGKVMSRSMTSRQGTVPIRFSSSNGLLKPLAMEKTLECTLEELCFGCVKKISVSRDAINDIGFLTREDEQLTIKVQPGWKKGTKLTFPGIGNEKLGTCQADIILVVTEKKHPMYARRDGHDLVMESKIPLVDALTGCMITVPLLGGEETNLKFDDEMIEPGFEKVIVGQGMPKSNEHGSRGNLVLQFLVVFPKELTDEQRREVCSILENVC